MDPYVWQRLWRRPWLSLCSLILSLVLSLLLGFLTDYRKNQELRLEDTRVNYDILCVVTNRRGIQADSLRMNRDAVDLVLDQSENGLGPYIRDLRITKDFYYTALDLGLFQGADLMVTGVSSPGCNALLDPEQEGFVTCWAPDFYEQDGDLCLVSRSLYDMLLERAETAAAETGETVDPEHLTLELDVTDPFVSSAIYDYVGAATVTFQVAGWYEGMGNRVFVSFNASQRMGNEISGGLRSADSISFFAADNTRLDEMWSIAATTFGAVDPGASDKSFPKVALTIYDQQYMATIAALEQNIARVTLLLPIVLVLGLGVGFLVSFLATRNEDRTYALMRTMGMTRGKLFFSVLREQMVLVALAALIALAVTREPGPVGLYVGCYLVGCGVCISRSIRVPLTTILKDQE